MAKGNFASVEQMRQHYGVQSSADSQQCGSAVTQRQTLCFNKFKKAFRVNPFLESQNILRPLEHV